MNTGPVSTRYATALLDHAIEKGEQETVYAKMKLLVAVFMEVPELRRALQDPSIPGAEKVNIIRAACGHTLPPALDEMVALIVKNEREEYMQFIAQRFIDLYRYRFRLQAGKLVTAVPVDKETEEKLLSRVRHITGGELEIETVVDPNIIGGFILNLDDYRWDASVTGELERLKHSLVK
jgi:F-type H+-transporting ATPase subunit delta